LTDHSPDDPRQLKGLQDGIGHPDAGDAMFSAARDLTAVVAELRALPAVVAGAVATELLAR
jgi:hypothetical protein